ncbi:hypothetical protein B296_00058743 [Ensete ventricosum]|uniref:Uncharacterized protein n=1 Tax=Ensete ventricosum TaxID=4639 RepID=A0A426X3Z7_ENSVE|nr:hypothetical protein B296_00058743 [Ensete ventricosum]
METTVAAPIPLLGSGLHRIRCLEESFFPDLEKDFSLGRIERGVRESRNGRLRPLRSSRGSQRWGSGRIGSRSLLKIKEHLSRLYHIRVDPRKVVGKARHISALGVPYNAICALNVATCSIELVPPLYSSSIGSRKCCRIGLSRTSGTKGDSPKSVEDHDQAAAWLGVVLPKIMPREGLWEPADVVGSTATRARGCRGQSLGSSPPRPALVE